MNEQPDPVRDAYRAWCDAEDVQAAAWDAYRQMEPGADSDGFMAWWAACEQVDAARATYTRLVLAKWEAADAR